jgi:excisionase family DNA binding protein
MQHDATISREQRRAPSQAPDSSKPQLESEFSQSSKVMRLRPEDRLLSRGPSLLRPNDVARLLSVSRAWVYDAARTGRIPSVRLGGDDGPLRFVGEDLEQWLAEARAAWLPGHREPSVPSLQ